MLARVIRRHWPALVRDVMALGYRASDILTTLSWHELLCVVLGSHPNTSVRFFLDSGWSKEAHILANMAEGQAGIAKLHEPYQRPDLDKRTPDPMSSGFFQADAYDWDEFDELQAKRYSKQTKPGNTRVRVL